MTVGEKIRAARKAKRMSQQEVATATGVSRAAVSQWENDDAQPEPAKIPGLADLLGVDPGSLLPRAARLTPPEAAGAPEPESARGLMPVFAAAEGGRDGDIIDYEHPADWIPVPKNLAGVEKACGVYVSGNSMENRYYDGEILHVHPRKPPKPGSFVLVELEGRRAIVKRMVRWVEGALEVEQLNPPEKRRIPRTEIAGVYRIVGSQES